MKSLSTFFFFFIVFSSAVFGQKIRFTDTLNRWTYIHASDPAPPYAPFFNQFWKYKGDTVVNAVVYRKLSCTGWAPPGLSLIREDIPNGKVYGKYVVYNDTNERLLFDYNLGLGDTMVTKVLNHRFFAVITSVDSVLMNNIWHKVQHFGNVSDSLQHYYGFNVTEGIGCDYDMLYSAYPHIDEPTSVLCSFTRNSFYYYGTLAGCSLTVGDEREPAQKIFVCPNPLVSYSAIRFKIPVTSGRILVYNSVGVLVYEAAINNTNHIPIGAFISTPGQYFYRITDTDKNQSYTGKFIFE